jgi:hypothetical protein
MDQTVSPPVRLLYLVRDEIELGALRRNGSVQAETHRGRALYKLRFRVEQKQCVRSLGRDPRVAKAVQLELDRWQLDRRDELAMGRAIETGRRLLTRARARLETDMEAAGYYFHGRTLRRRRKR